MSLAAFEALSWAATAALRAATPDSICWKRKNKRIRISVLPGNGSKIKTLTGQGRESRGQLLVKI